MFESRWGFQCQEEKFKPPCQFAIVDSNGFSKRFICNNRNVTKNQGAYPLSCFYLNRSDMSTYTSNAYVCSKVGETDRDCICENVEYALYKK